MNKMEVDKNEASSEGEGSSDDDDDASSEFSLGISPPSEPEEDPEAAFADPNDRFDPDLKPHFDFLEQVDAAFDELEAAIEPMLSVDHDALAQAPPLEQAAFDAVLSFGLMSLTYNTLRLQGQEVPETHEIHRQLDACKAAMAKISSAADKWETEHPDAPRVNLPWRAPRETGPTTRVNPDAARRVVTAALAANQRPSPPVREDHPRRPDPPHAEQGPAKKSKLRLKQPQRGRGFS